jgi:cell division septal protein FtsQ
MFAASSRWETSVPGKFARLFIVFIAVLALCAAGGWRALHSSLFTVRDVQVRGVDGPNADAARQAAALAGQRYFSLDSDAAVQRIEALPWVKSATVATSFPNRATISVTPRTPIGVWRVGAVNYLVDADGVVIGTADDSGALPVVDATDGNAVQIGDRIDPDPLVVAAQVDDFAGATLQQSVSRISYGRDTGVTVIAAHGVQIFLGDAAGLDHKLAVWQAIAQQTKAGGLHVLDLRGDRPYYR